jgi:AcrR family transcriptional regulator
MAGLTDSAEDPASTRARLREAALDLFGRQGIQATSTREIIKAAGMRNPSAINYYFGSKAKLIEDLTQEINGTNASLLQQHIAYATGPGPLTVDAWARIGVDFVLDLMSTERGWHLIRVWGEHDEQHPDRVEQFLAGTHPVAVAWRAAVLTMFPDLPPMVAIARNVIVIRTLSWITIRRARRLSDPTSHMWRSGVADLGPFLLELSVNILAGPTTLADADLTSS